MMTNSPESKTEAIGQAISWLRERLPQGWDVERQEGAADGARDSIEARRTQAVDSTISLKAPNGTFARIAVEEKQSLPPRAALDLLSPLAWRVRALGGDVPLLIVAPWLSERTRQVLADQRINYIDLSGNALVRLDNPALYLQTQGSARNPNPQKRGRVRLTGRRAARLIRLLVDVRPPYGVRDLAEATGLAPGYVSQLLDALYQEALIERAPRGPVKSVNIGGLVRRWAGSYDVFKSNEAELFVASSAGGMKDVLSVLGQKERGEPATTITGSVAAARLAPVAAPAMLAAYCEFPDSTARELNLLPADEGANVVLLRPFDPIVWKNTVIEDGLRYAAPSQVAADCLTGNGRMPSEGEALLEWMLNNEGDWRLPRLPEAGDVT